MPKIYERLGLQFQYPDNWILDEEEALAGNHSVTVYSPTGAFWSVVVHPADADPLGLAAAAVRALKEEYPDLETVAVEEEVAGLRTTGFDMNFSYLDLTSTATVRVGHHLGKTIAVVCQAEDRDYEQLSNVFRAITHSLLRPTSE